MDVLTKIDQYKELLDAKTALAEQTKANNDLVQKCRDELAEMMVEAETVKVARSGYSYSLTEKQKFSKKTGMDEALFDALKDAGLGDIIKPTVAPQTLQATMKELTEDNEGELPEEFSDVVNVFSFYDVTRRKLSK